MNESTGREGSPDAEQLRRLEARVVAGDLALQRQTEALLTVAADRSERVARWALLGLGGACLLLVLDMLVTRRGAGRAARLRTGVEPWTTSPRPPGYSTAARISRLAGPIAATGALWRLLPTISAAWRAVADVSAAMSRTRRHR